MIHVRMNETCMLWIDAAACINASSFRVEGWVLTKGGCLPIRRARRGLPHDLSAATSCKESTSRKTGPGESHRIASAAETFTGS